VKADLVLPVLDILPDGSYSSVLVSPKIGGKARQQLIEYEVPDRDGDGGGELIALITTITDPVTSPAPVLAQAYHERWEHETGNDQVKTHLRGPGRVLRSRSPDMVRQEIYGYLLTQHAISALICRAATEADIDPDRVKFTRTVRVVRRAIGPAAFPPLTSGNAPSRPSWPTSPGRRTSTRSAGTEPTPTLSSEPATTSTGSKDPATAAPATPGRQRSSSSTSARTGSQPDQLTLSGIGYTVRAVGQPENRQFELRPKGSSAIVAKPPAADLGLPDPGSASAAQQLDYLFVPGRNPPGCWVCEGGIGSWLLQWQQKKDAQEAVREALRVTAALAQAAKKDGSARRFLNGSVRRIAGPGSHVRTRRGRQRSR
jgi:hypothetical protein